MAPLLREFGMSGTRNIRTQGDLRIAYLAKVYP